MISVEDYQSHIFSQLTALSTERVPLSAALHRTLTAEVVSKVDLPPWPNSAMDGYAVRGDDLSQATLDRVISLPVVGDIAAGDSNHHVLEPGTTMRIMTGAPVPVGCDAVVALERTAAWVEGTRTADAPLPTQMGFVSDVTRGLNIRPQGDDIHRGNTVASSGDVITPNRLAAIVAAGVTEVEVSRRPRVAVISTGSELVPLGSELEFGRIFDSNGPLLASLVANENVELVSQLSVADDAHTLLQAVKECQSTADVIVLTGGASVGAYDTSRLVFDQDLLGEHPVDCDELRSVRFGSVAMQPGKPQGFGLLPDKTVIFCLPGNPVSVWVSFFLFIEPALRKLQGRTAFLARWQRATATAGFRSPRGREQFMPVVLEIDDHAALTVAPSAAKGSGSHLAASLGNATGIARVPASIEEVHPGDPLLVRGIDS
jgi:molybdopterin molybdotransferase